MNRIREDVSLGPVIGAEVASCGSCRFWHREPQGTMCRRYPPRAELTYVDSDPQTHMVKSMSVQTYFPPTPAQGWCGEHAGLDS